MWLLLLVLRSVVRSGTLKVSGPDGTQHILGDGAEPQISISIGSARAAWAMGLNPQLAFGEAYMRGDLVIAAPHRIEDLMALLMRNLGTAHGSGHLRWLAALRQAFRRLAQFNPLSRARQNVAHHYDLDGGLYELFLDADRQYSCAYFTHDGMSLEEAQAEKKKRIGAKLALSPGMSVLDIGSGWGGLGVSLAQNYGAHVQGVTLSQNQLAYAREMARAKNLSGSVQFDLKDYRHVEGAFDRIVSIGMFEHVGVAHYREYFSKIAALLKPDGVALVHSIGRSDGPGATNPWIAKYIFPGGYTPALSEVIPVVEQSGLIVTDVEILRLHYALTLQHWLARFRAQWERAKVLYDEEFCRMWEYYLVGAEMGFRHQGLMVFQLQLTSQVDALPIARDYMFSATARAETVPRPYSAQRVVA